MFSLTVLEIYLFALALGGLNMKKVWLNGGECLSFTGTSIICYWVCLVYPTLFSSVSVTAASSLFLVYLHE